MTFMADNHHCPVIIMEYIKYQKLALTSCSDLIKLLQKVNMKKLSCDVLEVNILIDSASVL